MKKVNKIKVSVFDNPEKSVAGEKAIKVIEKLKSLKIEIVDSIAKSDVVIVLGGDGTILHVARKAAFLKKAVLGINFGRIGFISSIEKDELDLLEKLVSKDYTIENRTMLEARINEKTFFAINDVVLSKGMLSKMVDIDLLSNKKIISRYRADGVIICTPTGSTAYSLSAGGSVIDPSISCMMITPVCPHMKFSYPLVFGDGTIIEARVYSRNEDKAFVCIDGENVMSIDEFDSVSVSVSNIPVSFVKLKNKTFFEALNSKLNNI